MPSLLEKHEKQYSMEDVAIEIEALIEEARSDLEMCNLVNVYDRDKQEIDRNGYNSYVKALKDLAERLGVNIHKIV